MIETYPGPHSNGIVADSSRFVRVSDSYVDTGDDGIVLKAGKDADGLRVNRPTENVTIANCTVHRAHGAVVIGSETAGSIRNVAASNIAALDTEVGIRLKPARARRHRRKYPVRQLDHGARRRRNSVDELLRDGRRDGNEAGAGLGKDAAIPQHRDQPHYDRRREKESR